MNKLFKGISYVGLPLSFIVCYVLDYMPPKLKSNMHHWIWGVPFICGIVTLVIVLVLVSLIYTAIN